jgi:hypothetical protein
MTSFIADNFQLPAARAQASGDTMDAEIDRLIGKIARHSECATAADNEIMDCRQVGDQKGERRARARHSKETKLETAAIKALRAAQPGTFDGLLTKLRWGLKFEVGNDPGMNCFLARAIGDIECLAGKVKQ